MQRTIFHLPGLAAARDALERDFTERVATPFNIDFRLAEACKPKRASKEDHCLLDLPLVPAGLHRSRTVSAGQGAWRQTCWCNGALRDRRLGRRAHHRAGRGPCDHRHSVEDLARLGADVERAVLSRAVSWHCEDRIIRYGNQTVVF
jgi:formyltetrahydrofolate hydrolase